MGNLSVKSVSLHKSASGLAHSTTLTRCTQPRERPQGTRPPTTRKLSGSAVYGVPASAAGNRPGQNALEPPGATSTRLSVKSVSHHKSASGLAHSTTRTRCTQPRERPQGARPPTTRKPSGSAGYGVPASAGGNRPGHNAPEPPWGHVHRPFGEIRVSPQKRERTRALHDAHALHTTAGASTRGTSANE
jgi:hypothetical protein